MLVCHRLGSDFYSTMTKLSELMNISSGGDQKVSKSSEAVFINRLRVGTTEKGTFRYLSEVDIADGGKSILNERVY
jgi:hypothetical protein